jgi:hypothetical protein
LMIPFCMIVAHVLGDTQGATNQVGYEERLNLASGRSKRVCIDWLCSLRYRCRIRRTVQRYHSNGK